MSNTELFICHAHADSELAKALVSLVKSHLHVPHKDAIRCTSSSTSALEPGSSIREQLREHVKAAKVVILIWTPNSARSEWVLIELAGAYSHEKRIVPVLAGTLTEEDLPVLIGKTDTVSVHLDSPTELDNMIKTLEKKLGWQAEHDSSGAAVALEDVINFAKNSSAGHRRPLPDQVPSDESKPHVLNNLLRNIKSRKCTPIIGPMARAQHLPTAPALAAKLADTTHYPFEDRNDFGRITKYIDTTTEDIGSSREKLAELLRHPVSTPNNHNPEPFATLARCYLPLYITTNYDSLMFAALREVRPAARRVVPAWRKALASIYDNDDSYGASAWDSVDPKEEHTYTTENAGPPTEESPIVFHLNGYTGDPDSMVVTEDDQLDFLIAMTKDFLDPKGQDRRDLVIPWYVADAINKTSLLLIGYRLYDWSFRVVTRLLKLKKIKKGRYQHPAHQTILQLPFKPQETTRQNAKRHEKGRQYIDKYLSNSGFTSHWRSIPEFSKELAEIQMKLEQS